MCIALLAWFFLGMIGTMSLEEDFTVLNPCSNLVTYHVHCSLVGAHHEKEHNSISKEPWSFSRTYVKISLPVNQLLYGPVSDTKFYTMLPEPVVTKG